jgi:hypothetical protein
MSIPLISLNKTLLRAWVPFKYLDMLVGEKVGSVQPIQTRSDLREALIRVRAFLKGQSDTAVAIVADIYKDGLMRVFTIQQRGDRMRVCIQRVKQEDLLVVESTPLIKSQPHLYYTWSGVEGFARLWFDTLKE